MKIFDYLRLGLAGVKAHKKRAFAVVIIVGALFGVLMTGAFILQGSENVVLGEMLAPTDGKVLIVSSVDGAVCKEGCDIAVEAAGIKKKVVQYGGEVVEAEAIEMAGETFYWLGEDVFKSAANDVNDGVVKVAVPLEVAAEMAEVEMPDFTASAMQRVRAVEEVWEEVSGKVIEGDNGDKYQIAEILPSRVYASDLAFYNVGQKDNLLDVVFGSIWTGESLNFIISEADARGAETEELGMVFAIFPDVESADGYYRDEVNYCTEIDRIFSTCSKKYKYKTVVAISDPLGTYEELQDIWLVFKIAVAVLAVIGAIIALSTYARLIGKDVKVVALYRAMGATGWQIRMIYVVYLVMLSIMAAGFAVIVGLILAVIVSLVNITALGQVFALGFGIVEKEIWLVGWNNLIWWLVGVMVIAAIMAVVLGNRQFRAQELAKRLK